jgi:hypothetical protein
MKPKVPSDVLKNKIQMKYILTLSIVLLFKTVTAFDIIDNVAVAFKSGNAKELAQHFSSTVELSILNKEDIYSNTQAELILKDFFQKNPPSAAKVIHKVISNANYKFGVIVLTTTKGLYRVSYELKINAGKFLVTQIRIEENKD